MFRDYWRVQGDRLAVPRSSSGPSRVIAESKEGRCPDWDAFGHTVYPNPPERRVAIREVERRLVDSVEVYAPPEYYRLSREPANVYAIRNDCHAWAGDSSGASS